MKLFCYSEWDGYEGVMRPVLLMLHSPGFDWTKTLDVKLEAPFESCTEDEFYYEAMSLTVPDHVYVRQVNGHRGKIGISMPLLAQYAHRLFAQSTNPPSLPDIARLVLRISDIEDMLVMERGVPVQKPAKP
ncbi:hypothetical protein ACX93W_21120 [Paenibacillus sp. CAU 1782]